jgi:hypothetical protein
LQINHGEVSTWLNDFTVQIFEDNRSRVGAHKMVDSSQKTQGIAAFKANKEGYLG